MKKTKPTKTKPKPKKTRKPVRKCEGGTQICMNKLIDLYGVNGSEKQGVTFWLCAACKVYLGRVNKLKAVEHGVQ